MAKKIAYFVYFNVTDFQVVYCDFFDENQMRWQTFLKQFEFTLIQSLAEHFKGQVNCGVRTPKAILEQLRELTIFKINPAMCDYLLLRALERMANLESEIDLSDKTRHNFFTFLRDQRPFEF